MLPHQSYYPDFNIWRWSFIILVCLGLPSNHGFKDMPFQSKNKEEKPTINGLHSSMDSQKSKNDITSNETENNSDLDDLRSLKKLLDDGIITQDDFDTKKKQILKL